MQNKTDHDERQHSKTADDATSDSSRTAVQHQDAKKEQRNGTAEMEPMEMEAKPRSCGQVWREYPKSVMLIVGNEFCERFSYYGMRAVLTLYMMSILGYSSSTASALYSGFIMLNYFSPLLGSILADGYIGKFHTILWVSLLYAAGNVTIALAASFDNDSSVHPWLDFLGLVIIALGTGGIKPCVQTFGGDQFRKGQERELQQFFSIFYFAINAGSTISFLLTPILRTMSCLGKTTCYPLAFGVPAALMVVAVGFFVVGSFWYKKVPPEGNVFAKLTKVVCVAVKNKRQFEVTRPHWLDHYMDSHSCQHDDECRTSIKCKKEEFVNDVKALLRVLVVYVPLPVFWALYDQQGSTWVVQGTQMNSILGGGVHVLPDQMGVLNAVLIMLLIPLFQFIIYPLFSKCIKLTPLRKMCVGGFLAGVAYVVCMFVQFSIKPTLPQLPGKGETLLTVVNYVRQCPSINFIAVDGQNTVINHTLQADQSSVFRVSGDRRIYWEFSDDQGGCDWVTQQQGTTSSTFLLAGNASYVIFSDNMADGQAQYTKTEKSDEGQIFFTLNVNYFVGSGVVPVIVELCKDISQSGECSKDSVDVHKPFLMNNRTSGYSDVLVGTWHVFVNDTVSSFYVGNFTKNEHGGIYTLTILPKRNSSHDLHLALLQLAPDNTISILWQIPQYFVISLAEVLFSITGNEFAYSQAPLSMKAVVMALWLLTDSVGNVIIIIIMSMASLSPDMSWIFLAYACLMTVIMTIFVFIAYRYKYKTYVNDDAKRA